MPAADVQGLEVHFSHDLVQYWGWFLAFGVGLTLLGIAGGARSHGDCRLDVVLRLAPGGGAGD
jgi:hypothetical protein